MTDKTEYSEEDQKQFFENYPIAGKCGVRESFLSAGECTALLSYLEPDKVKEGTVSKSNVVNYNIRKNRVRFLRKEQHPELSWLFERINHTVQEFTAIHFGISLGGLQHNFLQLGKYDKSDFYSWHQDSGRGINRQVSFSIQLSEADTYQGGELQLLTREGLQHTNKQIGSLSIFTSSTVHRVAPITEGTRCSLVGWFM